MLFSPKEKGQGMVEYALIIVLIAIVVIVVLTLLGTQISTVFSTIAAALAEPKYLVLSTMDPVCPGPIFLINIGPNHATSGWHNKALSSKL